MDLLINHIGGIASLVGSLTVVGSALIWIYNTFIGKPKERKREIEEEKRQQRMLEVITRENKPLNESINQLTEWLNESKADREKLNKVVVKNSEEIEYHRRKLNKHENRIIRLETHNGIHYKGGG